MHLIEAFEVQARACASLGSPMYAALLDRCAEDIRDGGVVADVLTGHEDVPGPSALALRLLGSVHRLVLERRAGELAAYYPSVGGTWETEGGWRAFTSLLAAEPEAVRAWLDQPPQTNDVGRSTALYGGLLQLSRVLPRVRLLEIGCSAGLNLYADQFGYLDDHGTRFGSSQPALVLEGAWRGRRLDDWPGLSIAERIGCDVSPVDPRTTEGRLRLTAYVWPDQRTRLERLRAALDVAQDAAQHAAQDAAQDAPRRSGPRVELRKQDAVAFLRSVELVEDTTTVLWHSVMWQYLSAADKAAAEERIAELGALATPTRRFAHLRAEQSRRSPGSEHEFLVRLTEWPGTGERLLGATVGHGLPTTWE